MKKAAPLRILDSDTLDTRAIVEGAITDSKQDQISDWVEVNRRLPTAPSAPPFGESTYGKRRYEPLRRPSRGASGVKR